MTLLTFLFSNLGVLNLQSMDQMQPSEPSHMAHGFPHESRNLLAGEWWPLKWPPSICQIPKSHAHSLPLPDQFMPLPPASGSGLGHIFSPSGPSWGQSMAPYPHCGARLGLVHVPIPPQSQVTLLSLSGPFLGYPDPHTWLDGSCHSHPGSCIWPSRQKNQAPLF